MTPWAGGTSHEQRAFLFRVRNDVLVCLSRDGTTDALALEGPVMSMTFPSARPSFAWAGS